MSIGKLLRKLYPLGLGTYSTIKITFVASFVLYPETAANLGQGDSNTMDVRGGRMEISKRSKGHVLAGLLMAAATPALFGQASAGPNDGKNWTAAEDHQNMMDQLGIKALRPGPSGNESAPNHANYDEATANPFPNLPDVLTLKNGKKVTTAAMWWNQRRPEIVEDFDREVLGRVPKNVPKVTWTVTETVQAMVGVSVSGRETDGRACGQCVVPAAQRRYPDDAGDAC